MRSRTLAAATAAALLCVPASARAKEYALPAASYTLRVERDGTARVEERITFAFSGRFSGAYRDVPLPPSAAVIRVGVAEGGRAYRPGGSTRIGGAGAPGTFGFARLRGGGARIVWHYAARDQRRTFTLRYDLRGVVVAHDDVVDVHPQVWGRNWPVALGRLRVVIELPARVPATQQSSYRVWGHPYTVKGRTARHPDRVTADLVDLPSGKSADVRVLFPRSLLAGAAPYARRARGRALAGIVADEDGSFHAFTQDRRRVARLRAHPLRAAPFLLAFGVVPALALLGALYWRFGREHRTGYDRRYEREPPDGLPPALIPGLLRQTPKPGSREFVATLFDLMQRGYYRMAPVGSDGTSDVVLEGAKGSRHKLAPHERHVADIVDDVLADGPVALREMGPRIRNDKNSIASTQYLRFQGAVMSALSGPEWFETAGLRVRRVLGWALLVAGGVLLYLADYGYKESANHWARVQRGGVGVCLGIIALTLFLAPRSAFIRRTRAAQESAERWAAFRRYLRDFPRLQQAPAISLALWERLLVYGIALGLATQVIEGGRAHLTDEILRQSLMWAPAVGTSGGGGGVSWSDGLTGALGPPAGAASGGGGGFGGGGGGGGFGGGGGGAW